MEETQRRTFLKEPLEGDGLPEKEEKRAGQIQRGRTSKGVGRGRETYRKTKTHTETQKMGPSQREERGPGNGEVTGPGSELVFLG